MNLEDYELIARYPSATAGRRFALAKRFNENPGSNEYDLKALDLVCRRLDEAGFQSLHASSTESRIYSAFVRRPLWINVDLEIGGSLFFFLDGAPFSDFARTFQTNQITPISEFLDQILDT